MVLAFARHGADVVIASRKQEACDALAEAVVAETGQRALALACHVGYWEECDALCAAALDHFGKVDILVNNAGMSPLYPSLKEVSEDLYDKVMAVNLTANWRLIRALDPLLRASPAGRAMFVTSGVAGGRAYWGTYAVSKTALEALVRTWVEETENTTLGINLIGPGAVRTGMRAAAYPGEDPMLLPAPGDITDVFVDLADAACTRHGEVVNVR